MIEEIGIVIKVEDVTAKVAVQKRGTCEGCAASGVCETSEGGMEIEALNQAQAKVGQTVKVSIKPQVYLKGAIFVYGIPLVAFIAGIIAGKNLGEAYIQSVNSDIVSFFVGFAAFMISFLAARAWGKKAETKVEYKPVIEEILQ
jgi:sigma-E factor negative regulatory protein RseC